MAPLQAVKSPESHLLGQVARDPEDHKDIGRCIRFASHGIPFLRLRAAIGQISVGQISVGQIAVGGSAPRSRLACGPTLYR
jgi:hypothetical protein